MHRLHTRFAHLALLAAMIALLALAVAACAQQAAPAAAPAQATSAPAAKQADAPTAAPKAAQPTTAPAAAQPTAAAAAAGAAGALPKLQGDKFVYWGGLIFSDKANKMLEDRIKEWGKARNVPVEVVMVNQNETVQKVSAAIQAGNAPDAFDLGRDFMLQLNTQNQLVPMDDLYKKIGDAHGGWLPPIAKATDPKTFNGKIPGIPFGVTGNV
ncbi:MAG: extracellular solute-binding protein, partial [Anaerolineae bacterium]